MGEAAVTHEQIRKLVGGYATGTLTEDERQLLFAAALEDQELFDELAGEQGFKEILDAPGARDRLIAAVTPAREPRRQSWWAWGAVGAAVAAGLVLFVTTRSAPEPVVQVASVKQAPPPPVENAPEAQLVQPAVPPPPAARPQPKSPAEPPPQSAQQGQLAFDATTSPAAPEARQQAADQTAAIAVQPETTLQKTESAETAALPPPSPAKQAQALPAEAAAKGALGGGLTQAPSALVTTGAASNASSFRAKGAPASPAAFGFTYERTADSLRIVPAALGFLAVTAGGQPLFSENRVLAGSNVVVPLPAGTGDVTVVFAAAAGTPTNQPVRREAATGNIADPSPSPTSRLAIIVPAVP